MSKETEKDRLKREFKRLFRNMDFLCDDYLNKEGVPEKEQERFADIYQQLGQVWEFLALQCKHWDGDKKTKEHEIDIAAERNVTLKERDVEYNIGKHRIDLDVEKPKKKGSKPPYGNFAFELRKKDLRHFPVIFKFDDDFKFLGLTILR
jgi:hypothetical protein